MLWASISIILEIINLGNQAVLKKVKLKLFSEFCSPLTKDLWYKMLTTLLFYQYRNFILKLLVPIKSYLQPYSGSVLCLTTFYDIQYHIKENTTQYLKQTRVRFMRLKYTVIHNFQNDI